jgi:PTH1 family peptidyl-tRNA hydrolase
MIVGLGNPGKKYERTRHNVGFMVIDALARALPGNGHVRRFDAELFERTIDGGRLILLKPQTYMNASGNAVAAAVRWYRVPLDHLLVVYDDLDLPFGQLRLRPSGSSGGHNGMKSIIDRLGRDEFPRLRIGIGRGQTSGAIGYVLSRFNTTEERQLRDVIDRAASAALTWQRDGIDVAMNEFNRRDTPAANKRAEGERSIQKADTRANESGKN